MQTRGHMVIAVTVGARFALDMVRQILREPVDPFEVAGAVLVIAGMVTAAP